MISVFISHGITSGIVAVNAVRFIVYNRFGPGILICVPVFIADPSYCCVGARAEEHAVCFIAGSLALVGLYGVVPEFKIILLGVRAAAFCPIHPDFHEMSVISVIIVSEDLFQLIIVIFIIVEIIIVLGCGVPVLVVISVAVVMNVPGGQVESHVHVIFCTCRRDLFQNIALAVLVACLRHVIIGVITCPDTEAVVVLCRDDQLFKSGVF